MITTVCLNPALDKTVTVETLTMGQVNRILSSRTDVGGKGVNVAVVCSRLGLKAQVIGCAGAEDVRKYRAAMDQEKVIHRFQTVEGSVRVNMKIEALDGSGVTELNEAGPSLSAEDLDQFIDQAIECFRASEYVVLSGSLPKGCPKDFYRTLIEMAAPVPCILDASGDALAEGIKAKPFLIKPNHHELAAVLGRELHSLADIRDAAQSFVDEDIKHVVVSMGKDGVLYVGEQGSFYVPEIPVKVRSTVGAGDSLVGGLLYGLVMYNGSFREALRAGAAAGTASVMTDGTQLIIPSDFMRLLDQVQIQDL